MNTNKRSIPPRAGAWLEFTVVSAGTIFHQQRRFGASGKYDHTPLRHLSKWFRSIAGLEPIGWYDLHARFSVLSE